MNALQKSAHLVTLGYTLGKFGFWRKPAIQAGWFYVIHGDLSEVWLEDEMGRVRDTWAMDWACAAKAAA